MCALIYIHTHSQKLARSTNMEGEICANRQISFKLIGTAHRLEGYCALTVNPCPLLLINHAFSTEMPRAPRFKADFLGFEYEVKQKLKNKVKPSGKAVQAKELLQL